MRRLIIALFMMIAVTCGSALADEYVSLQTRPDSICMMTAKGKTVCFEPDERGNWTVTTFDAEKKTVTKEDIQEIKYTR